MIHILRFYIKSLIKKESSKIFIKILQNMNISKSNAIQLLPLPLKNSLDYRSLYDLNTLGVAVNYLVLRKKKT